MYLDMYKAVKYKIEEHEGVLYVMCDSFDDEQKSDVELLCFADYFIGYEGILLSQEKLEKVAKSIDELLGESPEYLFKRSQERNYKIICDFFNEFGLFGILFHNVRKFVFPVADKGRQLAITRKSQEFEFTNTDKYKKVSEKGVKSPSSYCFDNFPEELYLSSKRSWAKASNVIKTFFPTLYSQNWSELNDIKDLMALYAEPLPLLKVVIEEILGFYTTVVGEDGVSRMTSSAVDDARILLGELTMTLENFDNNTYGWYQSSPSPLSVYMQNAIDFFNAYKYHRKCANQRCLKYFSTNKSSQKYCSDHCRKASFQRKTKIHECFICKAPLVGGQKKYCGKEKCKRLGENYRKWKSKNRGGKFKDWPGYQEIEVLKQNREPVLGGDSTFK